MNKLRKCSQSFITFQSQYPAAMGKCPRLPIAECYSTAKLQILTDKVFELCSSTQPINVEELKQLIANMNNESKRNVIISLLKSFISILGNLQSLPQSGVRHSLDRTKVKLNVVVKIFPECCKYNEGNEPYSLLHHYVNAVKPVDMKNLECILSANPAAGAQYVQTIIGPFTPVHILLMKTKPSYKAVLMVLKYCPDSARCETSADPDRKLPIHLLLAKNPIVVDHFSLSYRLYLEVLRLLLVLHPQGAFIPISEVVTEVIVLSPSRHFNAGTIANTATPAATSANNTTSNTTSDHLSSSAMRSLVGAVAGDYVAQRGRDSVITRVVRRTPVEKMLTCNDAKVRNIAAEFVHRKAYDRLQGQWKKQK